LGASRSRALPFSINSRDLIRRGRLPDGYRRTGLGNVAKLHDIYGKAVLGNVKDYHCSFSLFICQTFVARVVAIRGVHRRAA
jgi:hypothetical protein